MTGTTPDASGGRWQLLTVCTYTRTRSVMMAALLGRAFDRQLGPGAVEIHSTGFVRDGLPPIDAALDAMERRGLDVSAHRSSVATAEVVDRADLILTAERDHVVRVASLSRAAYARAVTLPELLVRVADAPRPGLGDRSDEVASNELRDWAVGLTAGRSAQDYLRRAVPEIADPTGSTMRVFEQAVDALEAQCDQAAAAISRVLTART